MPHRGHVVWLSLLLLWLAACQAGIPTSGAEVPRITVEELKALLDDGKQAVIVDARTAKSFEKRRVPGAISIPVREIEDRLDELPKDAPIAFY